HPPRIEGAAVACLPVARRQRACSGESTMSKVLRLQRAALLACCAIAVLGGSQFASRPAAAQFICVGNSTGATVPGATADGSGATVANSFDFACGHNASAASTGVGLPATATGSFARAGADSSAAFGAAAGALGSASSAVGFQAFAAGNNTSALGAG